MGTITIHSNKADDLYFINELARRLNLKTEIDTPPAEPTIGKMEPAIDYEDTPKRVVEKIQQSMDEIKLAREGKIKLQTLNELLDEF